MIALPYLLPLFCGLAVSVGSMFVKRSIEEGAGITRILFLIQIMFLAWLTPFALSQGLEMLDATYWWAPIAGAASIFMGSVFLLGGLRVGDVSVQVPLMGTKVVFVAAFTLFSSSLSVVDEFWIAVGLTFLGVFILGCGDLFKKGPTLTGIILTLLSSASFALADIVIATYTPYFKGLTLMFGIAVLLAFFSLGLIPFFRKSLFAIPKATWKWSIIASMIMAGQHVLLLITIGEYAQPTAANILYSSRGLWAILLVWFMGGLFRNNERHSAGGKVILRRAIGAILLLSAIVMVLKG